MGKKKVKELIQEVIRNNVDSLEFGNDNNNAPLRKANKVLHDALIESSKSDWISVEDTEECWQEMQKHQPFWWVMAKEDKSLSLITLMISERDIFINGIGGSDMYDLMEKYTFADGAVFGILEEE